MAPDLHVVFASALASLPEPHRTMLALYERGGSTAEGIGRALGISRAQARIGLRHARLAVRNRLAEHLRDGGW